MQADEERRATTMKVAGDYQTLLSQGRWEDWIQLWAEDGELDFPYAPAGRQRLYRGKAEILAYMRRASDGRIKITGIKEMRLIPGQDPGLLVGEITVEGHGVTTGAAYNQSYVMAFEVAGGKLKRYREYWNPLIAIDAFEAGDRAAWTAAFGSPEKAA